MEGSASIVMLAAGAIWGLDIGDSLGFFLLPAIAGIGGSLLVRRGRTVWKVVAIVLGAFAAVMLFWTAFGLAEPGSFFDFVPGLLLVGGLLIAVIAGVGSIRSRKRGAVDHAEGGERQAIRTVLVGLGTLTLLSAILSITGRETVSTAAARDADIVIDLKDFEFDQDSYATEGGSTILVRNSDPFLHTFTIDALDIDVKLTVGSEKLITIPDETGTFVLYCQPHTSDSEDPGDHDMAATFKIG